MNTKIQKTVNNYKKIKSNDIRMKLQKNIKYITIFFFIMTQQKLTKPVFLHHKMHGNIPQELKKITNTPVFLQHISS